MSFARDDVCSDGDLHNTIETFRYQISDLCDPVPDEAIISQQSYRAFGLLLFYLFCTGSKVVVASCTYLHTSTDDAIDTELCN